MNILQLMPQCPLPATDGGKVGLWNITKQFAMAGHRVHVLCHSLEPTPTVEFPTVTFEVIPINMRNTPWRIAKSVFVGRSLFVDKQDTPQIRAAISRILERESIDVIHADHTSMGPIAHWASEKYGVPWALRLHNVEWMIWHRYAERFPKWNPVRWYLLSQATKLRWDEADVLRQAPRVFAITDVDKERALQLAPSTTFIVAPGGVDIPESLPESLPVQTELVMASSWTWVHNAEGLQWFVDNVWPLIRKVMPTVTFGVLGKNPPSWLAAYTSQGIYAEGFVEDLYDRLMRSRVYVAPLFVGSGIRIKVLEALAAGLPVVATTISAEGIAISEAQGLLRRDDAQGTATAVLELLQDAQRACEVGKLGAAEVARGYTWKSTVGLMLETYHQLLKNHIDGRNT